MKTKLLRWALFAGVLLLSCSEDDGGGREPVFTPQGSLKVGNQIFEDGTVSIDYIQLNHDGWVAIYRYTDQREELLGYSFFEEGIHKDLTVALAESPALENTEIFLAMLHVDVNENGIFDWDGQTGIDVPLKRWDVEVSQQFSMYMKPEYSDYWITVEDQTLTTGPFWDSLKVIEIDLNLIKGLLESDTVWIMAYDWGVDGPNEIIGGSELLEVKKHEQVTIWIWEFVQRGDVLWLVLHDDTGERGVFEDTDPMVWDPENEGFLMTPVRILF